MVFKFKQQSSSSWLMIFLIVVMVHAGIFSFGFDFSPPTAVKPRSKVLVQTVQLHPPQLKIDLPPLALLDEPVEKNLEVSPPELNLPPKREDDLKKEELKSSQEPKPVPSPTPVKEKPKEVPIPKAPAVKKPVEKKVENKKQNNPAKPLSPPPIKKEVKPKENEADLKKKEADKKKIEEEKQRVQQEKVKKEKEAKEAAEAERKRKAEEQARIAAKEKETQDKLSQLKQFRSDKTQALADKDSQTKNLPKTIEHLNVDHLPSVEFSHIGNGGKEEVSYQDQVHYFLRKALIFPEYGAVDVKVTLNKQGKVVKYELIRNKSKKNATYLEKTIPLLVFPVVPEKLLDSSSHYTFTILLDNG